jgi:peptidyl-tRNA hydrolase
MADNELKMWLAVREDIEMSPGKMAVQSGHAFQILAIKVLQGNPDLLGKYLSASMPKIVVRAEGEAHIRRIEMAAANAGIFSATVTDAGRTEFEGPTLTVAAFGPCTREDLPPMLRRLRLL